MLPPNRFLTVASRKDMVQLHLGAPSALKEATRSFTILESSLYANKNLGSSGQLEVMTCECGNEHRHGKARQVAESEVSEPEEELCGANSNCVNRLTYMECYDEFCCDASCSNRRFQRHQHADVDVFRAGKKGYGVRALQPIAEGSFIYEYTGEVLDEQRFQKRQQKYDREGVKHFYFMMLQKDEFIDATEKGSIARFCNHSCNPNAQIEKWVVGPKLRMGLFAKRDIKKGEEICFDYKVDRYGSKAQPCYCGEANCSGFLGGRTQTGGTVLPPSVVEGLGLDSETALNWPESALRTLQEHVSRLGLDLEGVLFNEKPRAGSPQEPDHHQNETPPDQQRNLPLSKEGGVDPERKKSRRGRSRQAGLIALLDAQPSSLNAHSLMAQKQLLADLPCSPLTLDELPEFMRILMQGQERGWFITLLLRRALTTEHSVQLAILRMHGYEIMATVLNRWKADATVVETGISVLQQWPKTTRNKISSSQIEHVVKDFTTMNNPTIKAKAAALLDEWSGLSMGYRIPRRKLASREVSPVPTEEISVVRASKTPEASPEAVLATPETSFLNNDTLKKSDSRRLEDRPKTRRIVLPDGWETRLSSSGETYYYNAVTDTTSWKPPRDPRDIERESKLREQDQRAEKERLAALQRERSLQASEIQRIIDEAEAKDHSLAKQEDIHLGKPISSAANSDKTSSSTPTKAAKSSIETIFARYVPKLVFASEKTLGRDRCKGHARKIVHILAQKEQAKNTDPSTFELTPERKNKIKVFVKDYVTKIIARHAQKSLAEESSSSH